MINLTSVLPTISDTVTIDGWSEQDFAGTPMMELNGAGAGAVSGLTLNASSAGSTIRGMVINRFGESGIVILSNGNTILGNYVGTDISGMLDRGNTNDGIVIVYASARRRLGFDRNQ